MNVPVNFRPKFDTTRYGHFLPDLLLEKESPCPLTLDRHYWEGDKLVVRMYSEIPTNVYLKLPAEIVGKLLVWLRDRASPPKHPWWDVKFWIYRTKNDEWIWFDDASPEAFAFLPWKNGNRIVSGVMNT